MNCFIGSPLVSKRESSIHQTFTDIYSPLRNVEGLSKFPETIESDGAHPMGSRVCISLRVKGGRESQQNNRLHSPLAVHGPIQWALQGDVIKSRGRLIGV